MECKDTRGVRVGRRHLNRIRPADSAARYELARLRRRIGLTRTLPKAHGKPRLLDTVRGADRKTLLLRLAAQDAEYTVDEMLLLPDLVKYTALYDGGNEALLRDDYLDFISCSAAYKALADTLADKSRAEIVRVLQRVRDLAFFYGVDEAELARCAAALGKYLAEGDAVYYLTDAYEITVKNVLKRKRLAAFPEERETPFAGFRREDLMRFDDRFALLRESTQRFFRENIGASGLIGSVLDRRAKAGPKAFTPLSAAAVGFYLVTALDSGALSAAAFTDGAAKLLSSLERAEKWKGFPYAYTDLTTLAPCGIDYVSSYDGAVLLLALGLIRRAAVECAARDVEERAALLAGSMDLTVFLDRLRGRFRLGYYPARGEFDESFYRSLYGNGLLVHLVSGVEPDSLDDVVDDDFAALIANLFYPVYPYVRPRRRKKYESFWQFFLVETFYGKIDAVADRLYACCNWGMSERGDLDDLTYRPFSNALILLALDRENVLRRVGGMPPFRFRKPYYLNAGKPRPAPCLYEPASGKLRRHTLESQGLTLAAESRGTVRLFSGEEELAAPRLFVDGQPFCACVGLYRFRPDEARYLAETATVRIVCTYTLSGESLLLHVKQVPLAGESRYLTVCVPRLAQAMIFGPEGGEGEAPRAPVEPDLALRALGAERNDYDELRLGDRAEYTVRLGRLPRRERGKEESPAARNAALAALLASCGVPFEVYRPAAKATWSKKYGLDGRYTVEFTGAGFEDFFYAFPAGKYLAGCTALGLEELDVALVDGANKRAFSPTYAPLYREGTYSVTLGERSVTYTALFRELSLTLTVEERAGDLAVTCRAENLTERKTDYTLYVLSRGALAGHAPEGCKRELHLTRFGEQTAEFVFATSLHLSYDRPSRYTLDAGEKRLSAAFDRLLMPAMYTLPRYIDHLAERASDRQLAAFCKALLSFDTRVSCRLLKRLFERQKLEGDLTDRAVSYLLPYLAHCYMETTGDTDILEVQLGYADSEVQDEGKYHCMKCLELIPETETERMLAVFMLESFLASPVFSVNRLALIRRREELKSALVKSGAAEGESKLLYDVCVRGEAAGLLEKLEKRLSFPVVSFGKSAEEDVALALYADLLLTRVFGLVRRGDTLSFAPALSDVPEKLVLRCELSGSKLTLAYGRGAPNTVNVDGIDVSGDTRIRLPQKKRTLKVRVNV